MELNSYQRKAIRDLQDYLCSLEERRDVFAAYYEYWSNRDIPVGEGGVLPYNNTIAGTPHVCFKVPTGGGKTFMACASVKPIFDSMPAHKRQVVVWLVPSNAILEQTLRNLGNSSHPYRQRLDRDFSGRVEIYTKEALLGAQNFSPTAVIDQLSVCVLSYDSLRSAKKDGRKVYQENGQLAPFAETYTDLNTLVDGVDNTALIQVLNQLSPVTIVDESHNAKSDLSVEMLRNLNPSFVLDLTATPRTNSNIIAFVDARELKKENMVKLPVIVYNRNSKQDVLTDAIALRGSIERQAIDAEAAGGEYIRPIVLFQAQPKGKEDASTFQKLKEELVKLGIPQGEIAIKTSDINEIRNIDLLSRDCPVRYIITVNALKEGWDCPFAYILATLANKTSTVDVEQIVGRVLRQPYATRHSQPLLNNSYVLTCSNSFAETLDSIIRALNMAGFSRNDMRIREPQAPVHPIPVCQQFEITSEPQERAQMEEYLDIDFTAAKQTLDRQGTESNPALSEMIADAQVQAEAYEQETAQSVALGLLGGELGAKMNQFQMNPEYREEAEGLRLPMFFYHAAPNLFTAKNYERLTREKLSEGFSLRNADGNISFALSTGDMYAVDIQATGASVPKYQRMTKAESDYIRGRLETLPVERKVKMCVDMIVHHLETVRSIKDVVESSDLKLYVARVVSGVTNDDITALQTAVPFFAQKIQQKIEALLDIYREKAFNTELDAGELYCRPAFTFAKVITPADTFDGLSKSLYEVEASVNHFERHVIEAVSSLNNVRWWHRIIERKNNSFFINGFINHYPDFIVMTTLGNVVIIESKGDDRDNSNSQHKLNLGRKWADKAGERFRYFMVFENNDWKLDGSYTLDEFIPVMGRL